MGRVVGTCGFVAGSVCTSQVDTNMALCLSACAFVLRLSAIFKGGSEADWDISLSGIAADFHGAAAVLITDAPGGSKY